MYALIPTGIFLVFVVLGALTGFRRGFRKSFILLINMVISLSVAAIFFVYASKALTTHDISEYLSNIENALPGLTNGDLTGCKTAMDVIVWVGCSLFDDLEGVILDNESVKIITVFVTIFFQIILFILCELVIYPIVKFITYIGYLLFFSERRVIDRSYKTGVRYHPNRMGGFLVGGIRGCIIGFLVFSQLSTLLFVLAGGNFYTKEEYEEINIKFSNNELINEIYGSVKTSRTQGLGAFFDSLTVEGQTPMDYYLMDYVLGANYKNLNNKDIDYNLRNEFSNFFAIAEELYNKGIITYSNNELNYDLSKLSKESVDKIFNSLSNTDSITEMMPAVLSVIVNNKEELNLVIPDSIDKDAISSINFESDIKTLGGLAWNVLLLLEYQNITSEFNFNDIDYLNFDPEVVDEVLLGVSNLTLVTSVALPWGADYFLNNVDNSDILGDVVLNLDSIYWNKEIQNLEGLYKTFVDLDLNIESLGLETLFEIMENKEKLKLANSIITKIFNSDLVYEVSTSVLEYQLEKFLDSDEFFTKSNYSKDDLKSDIEILQSNISNGYTLYDAYTELQKEGLSLNSINDIRLDQYDMLNEVLCGTNNTKGLLDLNILEDKEVLVLNTLIKSFNVENEYITINDFKEMYQKWNLEDFKMEFRCLFNTLKEVTNLQLNYGELIKGKYNSLLECDSQNIADIVNELSKSKIASTALISAMETNSIASKNSFVKVPTFNTEQDRKNYWYGQENNIGELEKLFTGIKTILKYNDNTDSVLSIENLPLNTDGIYTLILESDVLSKSMVNQLIILAENKNVTNYIYIPEELKDYNNTAWYTSISKTKSNNEYSGELYNLINGGLILLGNSGEITVRDTFNFISSDVILNVEDINMAIFNSRILSYSTVNTLIHFSNDDGYVYVPDEYKDVELQDWYKDDGELHNILNVFPSILSEFGEIKVSDLFNYKSFNFNNRIINLTQVFDSINKSTILSHSLVKILKDQLKTQDMVCMPSYLEDVESDLWYGSKGELKSLLNIIVMAVGNEINIGEVIPSETNTIDNILDNTVYGLSVTNIDNQNVLVNSDIITTTIAYQLILQSLDDGVIGIPDTLKLADNIGWRKQNGEVSKILNAFSSLRSKDSKDLTVGNIMSIIKDNNEFTMLLNDIHITDSKGSNTIKNGIISSSVLANTLVKNIINISNTQNIISIPSEFASVDNNAWYEESGELYALLNSIESLVGNDLLLLDFTDQNKIKEKLYLIELTDELNQQAIINSKVLCATVASLLIDLEKDGTLVLPSNLKINGESNIDSYNWKDEINNLLICLTKLSTQGITVGSLIPKEDGTNIDILSNLYITDSSDTSNDRKESILNSNIISSTIVKTLVDETTTIIHIPTELNSDGKVHAYEKNGWYGLNGELSVLLDSLKVLMGYDLNVTTITNELENKISNMSITNNTNQEAIVNSKVLSSTTVKEIIKLSSESNSIIKIRSVYNDINNELWYGTTGELQKLFNSLKIIVGKDNNGEFKDLTINGVSELNFEEMTLTVELKEVILDSATLSSTLVNALINLGQNDVLAIPKDLQNFDVDSWYDDNRELELTLNAVLKITQNNECAFNKFIDTIAPEVIFSCGKEVSESSVINLTITNKIISQTTSIVVSKDDMYNNFGSTMIKKDQLIYLFDGLSVLKVSDFTGSQINLSDVIKEKENLLKSNIIVTTLSNQIIENNLLVYNNEQSMRLTSDFKPALSTSELSNLFNALDLLEIIDMNDLGNLTNIPNLTDEEIKVILTSGIIRLKFSEILMDSTLDIPAFVKEDAVVYVDNVESNYCNTVKTIKKDELNNLLAIYSNIGETPDPFDDSFSLDNILESEIMRYTISNQILSSVLKVAIKIEDAYGKILNVLDENNIIIASEIINLVSALKMLNVGMSTNNNFNIDNLDINSLSNDKIDAITKSAILSVEAGVLLLGQNKLVINSDYVYNVTLYDGTKVDIIKNSNLNNLLKAYNKAINMDLSNLDENDINTIIEDEYLALQFSSNIEDSGLNVPSDAIESSVDIYNNNVNVNLISKTELLNVLRAYQIVGGNPNPFDKQFNSQNWDLILSSSIMHSTISSNIIESGIKIPTTYDYINLETSDVKVGDVIINYGTMTNPDYRISKVEIKDFVSGINALGGKSYTNFNISLPALSTQEVRSKVLSSVILSYQVSDIILSDPILRLLAKDTDIKLVDLYEGNKQCETIMNTSIANVLNKYFSSK